MGLPQGLAVSLGTLACHLHVLAGFGVAVLAFLECGIAEGHVFQPTLG